MKNLTFSLLMIMSVFLSSCMQAEPQPAPTPTSIPPTTTPSASPSPTQPPSPTVTRTPTSTPIPSDTPIPPTPTTPPQPILLRRPCGRDYVVRADEPLQIFYGGWGVRGKDLADQWATALVIDLTIDGETVAGELQPPADDLPYNCKEDRYGDLYWLYSIVVIPGLSPGEHRISVIFNALRPLPDGSGVNFGAGQLLENTFRITAQ